MGSKDTNEVTDFACQTLIWLKLMKNYEEEDLPKISKNENVILDAVKSVSSWGNTIVHKIKG